MTCGAAMQFLGRSRVSPGTMFYLNLYIFVRIKQLDHCFHPGHFLCWERVLRKESTFFLVTLILGNKGSKRVSRFHQERLFTGEKKD